MTQEKIDQAKDSDSFDQLVEDIHSYITNQNTDLKDRLAIERKVKKYEESNSTDWLLNLIQSCYEKWQIKENKLTKL